MACIMACRLSDARGDRWLECSAGMPVPVPVAWQPVRSPLPCFIQLVRICRCCAAAAACTQRRHTDAVQSRAEIMGDADTVPRHAPVTHRPPLSLLVSHPASGFLQMPPATTLQGTPALHLCQCPLRPSSSGAPTLNELMAS